MHCPVHCPPMSQAEEEILLDVVFSARRGAAAHPLNALSEVAKLIARLDAGSPTYEEDRQMLAGIGGCLWLFYTSPF